MSEQRLQASLLVSQRRIKVSTISALSFLCLWALIVPDRLLYDIWNDNIDNIRKKIFMMMPFVININLLIWWLSLWIFLLKHFPYDDLVNIKKSLENWKGWEKFVLLFGESFHLKWMKFKHESFVRFLIGSRAEKWKHFFSFLTRQQLLQCHQDWFCCLKRCKSNHSRNNKQTASMWSEREKLKWKCQGTKLLLRENWKVFSLPSWHLWWLAWLWKTDNE